MHSIDHWLQNYKSIGDDNGYSEHEIEEYHQYLLLVKKLAEIKSPNVVGVLEDE